MLVALTLLAVACHTVCDIADRLWRATRKRLGPRYNCLAKLAGVTEFLIFAAREAPLLTLARAKPLPVLS